MPQTGAPVRIVDENGDPVDLGAGGGGTATSTVEEQEAQTALLAAIDGRVDTLETLIAATNTALGTIDTRVDGLESVLGTTADAAITTSASGSLSGKMRGLVSLIATQNALLDGVEAYLEAIDSVKGYTALTSVEITRPADTTAYAAKDAISTSTSAPTILTFADCARFIGGGGYITKARLQTDQAANVATYRLHLYNATLAAVNDNAAQTVLYVNKGSYLGYIDFPAASTDGSDTANSISTAAPFPFLTNGSTSLFGMLETTTAFTPASGQKFFVQLTCDQN